MIVVEEQTTLEVRDCYMRSIRRDAGVVLQQPVKLDNFESMNQRLKTQLECDEIGVLVEPRAWAIGPSSRRKHSFLKDIERVQKAEVHLMSCIFFNFFDQCRIGYDTTVLLEKCHLSEARNTSIHALNPRVLKVIECNFSKPGRHCILSEWLPTSTRTEKCRNLQVEGCDMYSSGATSILV